jgi:hypothetical protein
MKQISEVEEKPLRSSLNTCHLHLISQLIRGYFIKRRRNRHSPPRRVFFLTGILLTRFNIESCKNKINIIQSQSAVEVIINHPFRDNEKLKLCCTQGDFFRKKNLSYSIQHATQIIHCSKQ